MSAAAQPGEWARLEGLIRDIGTGLLTTKDGSGGLHTRPLQTLRVGAGELWFFTDWGSPKVAELGHDAHVSVSYADVGRHQFAVVSGSGDLLRDAALARHLWRMEQRAYYPEGPEDARLALLRVRIEHAEYWIAPTRAFYLVAAAKAFATGEPVPVIGTNRKL